MTHTRLKIKRPMEQFHEVVPDVYQPVIMTVLDWLNEPIATYQRHNGGYWFEVVDGIAGIVPVDMYAALEKAWTLDIETVGISPNSSASEMPNTVLRPASRTPEDRDPIWRSNRWPNGRQ